MLAASRKAVAPMFETTVCYPWATSGAGWGLQRIADCSFATGSQPCQRFGGSWQLVHFRKKHFINTNTLLDARRPLILIGTVLHRFRIVAQILTAWSS